MITATCQVGETTGASHYLTSSALPAVSVLANLSELKRFLLPQALSLSPPTVLFVGNWSLIYRRTDLPGVADERLMGSNSS